MVIHMDHATENMLPSYLKYQIRDQTKRIQSPVLSVMEG